MILASPRLHSPQALSRKRLVKSILGLYPECTVGREAVACRAHEACDVLLDSEGLLKNKEKNQKLYSRAQRHQEKKEKIQRHNRKLGDLVEKKTIDLKSHYERLARLRRSHILELTSVIFPMDEVKTAVRYSRRLWHVGPDAEDYVFRMSALTGPCSRVLAFLV